MKYGDVFFAHRVYGKSGMSQWLWKCTKSFNSVKDHLLSESKVLGLSLQFYKCFLDIGIMTIESIPHPLGERAFGLMLTLIVSIILSIIPIKQ